ncbi:MAG: hypothetical protein VCD16_04700 [Planctomycetota bacterium]|jgi:hypothetical protein|tara:strand:- start:125 stop:250 length:126 start_codon:yes stop_codon:yes gene_type:complete
MRYLIFIGIGMVAGFLLGRALYLRPEDDVDAEEAPAEESED